MAVIEIFYKREIHNVLVDDEDYERVVEAGPWYIFRRPGKADRVRSHPKRGSIQLHRFVLKLKPGDPDVDHIDRNSLNNQKHNLRLVTSGQNKQNIDPRGYRTNTSSYRGVFLDKDKKRWKAAHRLNGRLHHIGYFDTPEEASEAATAWRREHYTHSDPLCVVTCDK